MINVGFISDFLLYDCFIYLQDQVQIGHLAEILLPIRLQAQEEGCLDPLECSL